MARNLHPFVARVHTMGVIGPGRMGDLLLENLREQGLGTEDVFRDETYETIVKTRVVARSQQVVRIDRETPRPVAAAVAERVRERFEQRLAEVDAVIIEDYAKGLLGQPLVDAVISAAVSRGLPVTVDPNPNNPVEWRGVTAVKPNRLEAFQAAGLPDQSLGEDLAKDPVLLEVGRRLFDRWACEHLLITLGERGLLLLTQGQEPWHSPPQAHEVFDVSGAGDTAIALFTLALGSGSSAREAAYLSNLASSIVVGKVGTATITREELLKGVRTAYRLRHNPLDES